MSSNDLDPRALLAAELSDLRTLVGEPSYKSMATMLRKNHEDPVGATALRNAVAGEGVPRLPTVIQFVTACRLIAAKNRPDLDTAIFNIDLWHARWKTIGAPADSDTELRLAELRSLAQEQDTVIGRGADEEIHTDPADASARAVMVGAVPRRSAHFVYRDQFAELSIGLTQGRGAVVVTGMRGAGKTQLAASYARHVLDHEKNLLVGWVNAETPGALHSGLAEIAEHLGVSAIDGDPVKSTHRLRDHLNNDPSAHLLVLDNATDPDLLRSVLPTRGGARIVITTTDQAMAHIADVPPLTVGGYTPDEACTFLRGATGITDDLDGEAELAEELGYLPLALAAAAAAITAPRPRLTYPDYLGKLRSQPLPRALRRRAGTDHPLRTDQALMLSVEAAEAATDDIELDTVVAWLDRLFAVFASSGVRRNLLRHRDPELDILVDDAIERCVRHSLLTWSAGEDRLLTHRLTARVLLECVRDNGTGDELLTDALDVVQPQLFGYEHAWANRVEGADLVDQIEAIWASKLSPQPSDNLHDRVVTIRLWAISQLNGTASFDRAVTIAQQTLVYCERVLGSDNPNTLNCRNNLTYALASTGRLAEAIPLYEQNLTGCERVLGPDHPETLAARNNLAYALTSAGNLEKAITTYEQTIISCEEVLGPDHPDTVASWNNLAAALEAAGYLSDAIRMYGRTLVVRERILGSDHPETLASCNNLACALTSAGHFADAIALHEQNLIDCERSLGLDHPDTLSYRNNLAYTLKWAGHFGEAVALFAQNVIEQERVSGPDHPDTLSSRKSLTYALVAAGQVADAIALHEQNLLDCERVLGSDHPLTALIRADLDELR
ncbi:FxSxx-COOH system tetratricopeptide repeat protein [Nocardia sp. NPDC058058]|uniref:FxSxx-COOH system tetratricopeptide repeat protein n=1 Tax=Nocardia sp. NPDC058058 TaxID=3346317 RepID=UPI0036DC482C